jgi:hypothetical protein
MYLEPGAPYEEELLSDPFFDPAHFFLAEDATLPDKLVHFIYHTYPTDSYLLAEAAVRDLTAGRVRRAEQLFSVGAVPTLAPNDVFHAATCAELKGVSGVSKTYPSERLLAWKNRDVERTVCSCGFDAGAEAANVLAHSVLAMASDNVKPAQAVKLLQRKIHDLSTNRWERVNGNASVDHPRHILQMDDEIEYAMDKVAFGSCRFMKYWMMPFNGTIGKYAHPLSELMEDFERCDRDCQHGVSMTREFLVAYVLDLKNRLL